MDLWGHLSNPLSTLDTASDQGLKTSEGGSKVSVDGSEPDTSASSPSPGDLKGRHSNPGSLSIQRRLTILEIDRLVVGYLKGRSVRELAREFGIHRTCVSAHLERRGIPRRANVRKLCDNQVAQAAGVYRAGAALAEVAQLFGVHTETLRREFKKVGGVLRPRRGRQS